MRSASSDLEAVAARLAAGEDARTATPLGGADHLHRRVVRPGVSAGQPSPPPDEEPTQSRAARTLVGWKQTRRRATQAAEDGVPGFAGVQVHGRGGPPSPGFRISARLRRPS